MSDVTVIVKTKGADQAAKDVKSVGDAAEHAHGPISKMGGALGDVAKIASGFVVAQGLMKLPDLFGSIIGGASDMNESLSKLQAVFGTQAKGIEAWASSAATNLGMTKQAAIEATATFGNFLQAMGTGPGAAGDMSKAMVQLAADLGSFNNANPEEVLLALRSGLSGESEPLRKFGVALSEAAVSAKAVELGISATGKEMTEQQKIQARYAIIMEQTKTAQGDFARTSDGLANSTKILSAMFSDAATQLGSALLPGIVALAQGLVAILPAVIDVGAAIAEKLVSGLKAIGEIAWNAFTDAWTVAGPVLMSLAGMAWDGLIALANASWQAIGDAWRVIAPALEKIAGMTWDALVDLANVNWGPMRDAWDAIGSKLASFPWGKLKDEVTDATNWGNAWSGVQQKIQPAIDAIKPFVEGVLAQLKQAWLDITAALAPLAPALADLVEAFKPLQPLIEPLLTILGVTLVVAIDTLLISLRIFIAFIAGALTLAIDGLVLTIKGITTAVEFVTKVFTDWPPILGQALGAVVTTITANVSMIKDAFTDTDWWALGRAVVQGIWDGMVSLWSSFIGWIEARIDDLPWVVKKVLGIGSPSKVFTKIGEQVVEGFNLGIMAGMPGVITYWSDVLGGWVNELFSMTNIPSPTVNSSGNWPSLPPWAGMSTTPAAGGGQSWNVLPSSGTSPTPPNAGPPGMIWQYIGGGQYGFRPYNPLSIDQYGSYYQGGQGTQTYDPSLPNYEPSAIANRIPDYIVVRMNNEVVLTAARDEAARGM